MGDLVDSIVRVFEFLIQGFLALCVVGFALVWFHPIKRALFSYAEAIHKFVVGKMKIRKEITTLVLLGLVYFLGNLTNVIGYWILEPVHHLAIIDAYSVRGQTPPVKLIPPKYPSLYAIALLPLERVIKGEQHEDQIAVYANYLRQEVMWRNCNLDALSHALDSQIKQFRIIRGTIVCSLAICVIALAKGIYFMLITLIWPLLKSSRRSYRLVEWLYEHTVDPSAMELSEQPLESSSKRAIDPGNDHRLRQTFRYAVAAFTVSGLSLLLYLLALSGWHTIEREYHLMVQFGAESCVPRAK